jgi:hypothetical protein
LEYSRLETGSKEISVLIKNGIPFFVGRLGSVESEIVLRDNLDSLKFLKSNLNFHDQIRLRKEAWNSAGVWPPTKSQLRQFSEIYQDALHHMDVCAEWGRETLAHEEEALSALNHKAIRIALGSLDPILLASLEIEPWTLALKDLNVLVVSPFSHEIENQYKKSPLHSLRVLPDFNLFTLSPPQTNGLQISLKTWKENFFNFKDKIQESILKHEIDVVLVSAGSYGLPICHEVFKMRKSAIYVGGALQIVFGIWGSRWKNSSYVHSVSNENWIWPNKSAKPFGAFLIEKSCYW